MGRISDALKRSKTGVVVRRGPGSPSDAEEGLRFLGAEQASVVGPWILDDEPERARLSGPPAVPAPAPTAPAEHASASVLPDVLIQKRPAPAWSPSSAAAGRLILSAGLSDVAREQYRRLAAALEEIQADRGIKVVMITSAVTAEGKTLTAANLALTLAESFNRQVALIEADLRRPSIHALLGLNGGSQSVGELFGEGPVPLVQVRPTLSVFAPADRMADPITALSSARMRQIVEAARSKFDWVVLDTPPVGLLPDAHVLSPLVDGIVLVVAAGQTAYPAAQRVCQVLGVHKLLGVVLNRADRRALDSNTAYDEYYAEPRAT